VDFLHKYAKNPDCQGCFGSLQDIKVHFREFLYDFALTCNKLPAGFRSAAFNTEVLKERLYNYYILQSSNTHAGAEKKRTCGI
jgi:hypothetical protein